MLAEDEVGTGIVFADDIPCLACHVLAVLWGQSLNRLLKGDVCHYFKFNFEKF